MKWIPSAALLIIVLFSSAIIQAQPSGQFKRKLQKFGLEFYMPVDYVNVPVAQNVLLPNEFAISKSEEEFEIRYQITPLQKELKAYKKNLKNPTLKLSHPNYLWKSVLTGRINALAIHQDSMPKLREFSLEAFDPDFIGDGGGICFFEVAPESQLGYAYAICMVIHRNFKADLYVTFLGNDQDKLELYSLEAFKAMRFKE